ncbi:sel1 repeat family protein [Clostridium estertheticum]|uniref:tetratricopeptide repeat protein n=1 Tax=Clostridium estertheticum TaxID=238834 RepID=UPI001C0DE59D|nr:tetratricopeptide repeat protein [Clostridium estertheticum]MBU3178388.1 sel1 repeat family protein [Clostridium estertheticum]
MNIVEIWYNYYLKETKFIYNEKEEIIFEQIQNKTIQEWINAIIEPRIRWSGFFEELFKVVPMLGLQIKFYGREKDCAIMCNLLNKHPELDTQIERIDKSIVDFNLCGKNIQEFSADDLLNKAKIMQKTNIKDSIFYFKEAERKGSSQASYILGMYYGNKDLEDFDLKRSIEYFMKGANNNHVEAQRELGVCYFYGTGVNCDKKEAIKWFLCAADKGDVRAQYNLGLCLLHGIGVTSNPEKAVSWLEKSSLQNDSESQYELAQCYVKGIGTKKNIKKGLKWFYFSEQNGNEIAEIEIDKILAGENSAR